MPKDATKNVDRYKIQGGQINEFEYSQNQKAVAGKKAKAGGKLIPGTPPEDAAQATSKTTKSTKATKKTSSSTKGVSAKKLATRKATTKKK